MYGIEKLEKELSKIYKVKQSNNKLFINNKVMIQISVLGRNGIIICDTIFCGKKYITYLISLKDNNIPNQMIDKILTHLNDEKLKN